MIMSKIYNTDGYVNWEYLYQQTPAFCMVTGARATGKTYGLLKYCVENSIKFLYLRRLGTQLQQCASENANPFKKLNTDCGWNIQPYKKRDMVLFTESTYNDGKKVATGETVAVGAALSTFATLRGVDFSDIDAIVFDEAIPMVGEKPIKNEFDAFNNFYESVNRNRELEGSPPVKCFLLGNANQLANPYYAGWGFMRTALNMIRGGQMMYRAPEGNRIMVMLLNSPISGKKRETALYRGASKDFASMALDNAFKTDETHIKPRKLSELLPLCGVGEIGIYRIKSGGLYVSNTVPKDVYYDAHGIRLKMFRRDLAILRPSYLRGSISFEDYNAELIFRDIVDI